MPDFTGCSQSYGLLNAVRRIEFYVVGISEEEFSRNGEKQDAVILNTAVEPLINANGR